MILFHRLIAERRENANRPFDRFTADSPQARMMAQLV